MSLRSDLLAAAVAQRDRVLAELAKDPDLRHVARFEWGVIVDKLSSGGAYWLTRDELPRTHPARWRGKSLDVLTLVGDERLHAA